MSTLRKAIDTIKENILLVLLAEGQLTFDELIQRKQFEHTALPGIRMAIEELVYEEEIQSDKQGRYFILS